MAVRCLDLFKNLQILKLGERFFHQTTPCLIVQSGRYKPTPRRTKPLTYEMAMSPSKIAHKKSWNSWNTSTIQGGLRPRQTTLDDITIRRFMAGTFPGLLLSEIIIKRQHNMIRVAAIVSSKINPRKVCFLIGYFEELLSYWLQCIVKLELVFEADPTKVVFKYI